jgi:O-antigen/teichoic acid export membrane protein
MASKSHPGRSETDGASAPGARPQGNLRRLLFRETAWHALGSYSALGVSFVVTTLLARQLSPGDFGVLTLAVTVTAFFEMLIEVSLGRAIIHRDTPDQRDLSSVFWFGLGLAVAAYLTLLGVLYIMTGPRGDSGFVAALSVLGSNVVLAGLLLVPTSLLSRQLSSSRLSLAHLAGVGVSGGLALYLAHQGFGYWALVAQVLTLNALRVGAAFRLARWRPSLIFSPSAVRDVCRGSSGMVLHGALNYWSRNAGNVVIARFLGPVALGEYNLATRLMSLPVQLFDRALRPSLLSSFVVLRDEPVRMRRAYRTLVEVVGTASLSLAALLVLTAEHLVPVLWGPQWENSIPVVYAFVPFVAVQPIVALVGPIYLAHNATRQYLQAGLVNAFAVLAGVSVGIRWGAVGAAWGFSLSYVGVVAPYVTLLAQARLLGEPLRDYGTWLIRPILIGLAVYIVGTLGGWLSGETAGPIRYLIGASVGALAGFSLAVRLVSWNLIMMLWHGEKGPGVGPVSMP